MIIKKDSEIVKAKGERKSLALKAKKESRDKGCSTSGSEDEEYAMVVRDFKKFFKRRGRCEDPNHLIGECPNPPKDKNQRAFVRGFWSDSDEEDDEKARDETCLMAQASSEVHSESSYFSDENSSIDDIILDSEYNRLCKMSLKIISKSKHLKAIRKSLENKINELEEKLSKLERNKEVDLECTKCQSLKIDNEKLKEEALKITHFQKSTRSLNQMLSFQKPSGDKSDFGFNSFKASTSGTKETKFVNSQNKTSTDGGPLIAKGGPHNAHMAFKTNRDRLSVPLMCPNLVTHEKKNIERYIRGLPERVKANVTSSKPTSLHDAINRARDLIEQAIQAKATRIGESNKRKWEDHQINNNNNHNNNTYHQQQNRRQEVAKAYTAALAKRKGCLGNRPLHAIWSLNEGILKITILKTNTSYPSRKIRRIRACTHQRPQRNEAQYAIWNDDDIHDLRSVETEFPAIAFNDEVSSKALSCEPTVSSLNNKIDFRISLDDSDDEDYTVIFEKNLFSYKNFSTNDLKTDSKNDNEKVITSLPSPEPAISCFDDLDFFKDFENEFPTIVYNDALTSKSDFLTEPTVSPEHINEFNLKDETSLSECDEEEQNVLYFNDLFSFNVNYPDDSKSDEDNDDDDKINIEHSSGDLSVKPLPDIINTDDSAYAHGSNKLLETSLDTSNGFFKTETFIKKLNVNIVTSQSVRRIRKKNTAYWIQVSIRRILGYGYGISTSCIVLGPREGKSTNVGGEFTNLEILKCWSLETSRRCPVRVIKLRRPRHFGAKRRVNLRDQYTRSAKPIRLSSFYRPHPPGRGPRLWRIKRPLPDFEEYACFIQVIFDEKKLGSS
ncbi:hypothetical protein Tco_1234980 [Tanacetum coccineum]